MLIILMFIILKLFVNVSYANYAHAYEINDGVNNDYNYYNNYDV